MQKHNVADFKSFFKVLQTGTQTQTAIMTLKPGEASGAKSNEHPQSDQVLLVLEGELKAEIGEELTTLVKGDVVIVPAGVDHRFSNESLLAASTFNVYGPPAY
ncbi:MAG: cupin domain-containing protein [Candidatus Eremiobacteraeota bacterium]|nr:cupin domain-containing protein [Candidatus Eremiobacteraeota bacterium]